MSINSRDNELLDNDPTDELPILVETAVLDPAVVTAAVAPGDSVSVEDATGEHTARYPTIDDTGGPSASVVALQSDLQARAAKIEALEVDIRKLSGRWLDVEQRLTDKEAVIENVTAALAASKQALEDQVNTAQRLAMEHADRGKQLEDLLDEQRRQSTARQLELEQERQRSRDFEAELNAAREQLAKPPPRPPDERLLALQEETATLKGYIDNRRSRWETLEATTAAALTRIGELERELAHRAARQQSAEGLAQRESARAESFRRELIEASRAVQSREADVTALRAAHAEPKGTLEYLRAQLAEATELNRRLQAALDAAMQREAELTAATPVPEPASSPSFEVIAQVEAELEHKRTQVGNQSEQLRAQEERLGAAAADLGELRRQSTETRAQLEQSRADIGRLERTLIDKDRVLDARNERIATLQKELEQKLGALQKLNAMDLSLQGLDAKMSERLKQPESAEQMRNIPSLVCLTSDSPRNYTLSKSTMTIGRSSQCDIQVFTHFVSREHAKLTIDSARVVIEDLGSTNGVFVNSVRVDRQELRHSDLVTVGETQFRFLERMAH
jgi:chromosome segregation ATPase